MTMVLTQLVKFLPIAFIVLISSLFSSTVHAESAEMWLDKMNKAVHSLNYTGTYVYINQGQIETMQIVHAVDEGGERERLLSLNGEAREILRDSESVTCILPANNLVVVGKLTSGRLGSGLPALVPEDIQQLNEFYDVELIGRDRIASYPTVIISIQPKDKMRYGYRIWLEEESAMVLRSDIIDVKGKIMEQMMFTDISLQSPISLAMLKSTVPHEGFRRVTDLNHAAGESSQASVWRFTEMPKGFKVTSRTRKNMPMKKHHIEHIILSDGLATVSVYIEKATGEATLKGGSSMGGINAYGRQIDNYFVTVMGEVPRVTVKQIAESVTSSH